MAYSHTNKSTRGARLALRLASRVACILAWQWASSTHVNLGLVTFQNVPSPKDVVQAAWELLHSPKLLAHLAASLSRVFAGFVTAAGVGIVLGMLIGRSRRLADILLPPLEVLRPIPAVAWMRSRPGNSSVCWVRPAAANRRC